VTHTTVALDCVDLELSQVPDAGPGRPARVLVRLHGHPLGVVEVDADARAADGGAAAALAAFGDAVVAHLAADGLDPARRHEAARCAWDGPEPHGLVSVVVCTIGEDPRLRATVESVLAQSYADLEVVVVDNRPGTSRVAEHLAGIEDPRVRVVTEPCRGLSAARNAGLRAARGEVVAYTDDDARADRDWVRHLAGALAADPRVVAATGLVVPDELRTQAQHLFEEFGGFDKGVSRTLWAARPFALPAGLRHEVGEHGALFPYSAGVYGSGNNMAFRTSWLRSSGLFDEALGAGSLTKGGEDLDAFVTVMLAGAALVYEPAAIVRHSARATMPELSAQLYGYGSGNSAAIVKHVLGGPRGALAVARRVPAGLRRLLDPRSGKNERRTEGYPPDLARQELRGFAAGPALYVRSRREARRRRAADPLAG
jgi:cellulose synthase/poly-beta-1,6-N-acetylglucosamine synthase-like glycosyltransferase